MRNSSFSPSSRLNGPRSYVFLQLTEGPFGPGNGLTDACQFLFVLPLPELTHEVPVPFEPEARLPQLFDPVERKRGLIEPERVGAGARCRVPTARAQSVFWMTTAMPDASLRDWSRYRKSVMREDPAPGHQHGPRRSGEAGEIAYVLLPGHEQGRDALFFHEQPEPEHATAFRSLHRFFQRRS